MLPETALPALSSVAVLNKFSYRFWIFSKLWVIVLLCHNEFRRLLIWKLIFFETEYIGKAWLHYNELLQWNTWVIFISTRQQKGFHSTNRRLEYRTGAVWCSSRPCPIWKSLRSDSNPIWFNWGLRVDNFQPDTSCCYHHRWFKSGVRWLKLSFRGTH